MQLRFFHFSIVEDALAEEIYDADIAGLGYSLYCTKTGLTLTFTGYNHRST
jgi:secreted Zn-dependent insulinase-like peptidase